MAGRPQRFQILETLGEGAWGRVLLARDLRAAARLVALKVPRETDGGASMAQEFRLLTGLRHPSLVEVLDLADEEALGGTVLVLEYFQARPSLEALSGRSWPEVLAPVGPVVLGLDFLHDRGLLHGDVKPSNLLVSDDGRARWTDYGFTRPLSATGRAPIQGTLEYAAPEVLAARPADGRADLYSFGATLFHLLVGRPPFAATQAGDLIQAHLESTPAIPRSAELPQGVASLLRDLLAKDPADRPASGREIVDRLRPVEGLTIDTTDVESGRARSASAPLVAREAHLDTITRWLDAIAAPSEADGAPLPTAVVLVGEGGSGRTRLLAECRREARTRRLDWIDLPLPGPLDPPLALAAALLDQLVMRVPHEAVKAAAPLLGALARDRESEPASGATPLMPPDPAVAASGIREAIAGLAVEAASGGLVIAVDRIDSADAASRAVLLRAGQRLARGRGLLVATSGDREFGGERAVRIELAPMSPAEVGTFLERAFAGSRIEPELATKVHRLAGGNPGLLAEVVREWIDSGFVQRDGERWAVPRARELPEGTPRSVAALAARRLDRIDLAGRTLLTTLSVLRQASPLVLIARIAALPPEDVREGLATLVREGLAVREGSGPRARFALARTELEGPLLDALADDERREIHHRAAEGLEDLLRDAGEPERSTAAAAIAAHWDAAGRPEAAAPHHAAAGRRALSLHAPAAAIRHLEAAREISGRVPAPELLYDLGEAFFAAGRRRDSAEAHREAEEAFLTIGHHHRALDAAVRRASALVQTGSEQASEMCQRLLELARGLERRDAEAAALCYIGMQRSLGERHDDALVWYERGITVARSSTQPAVLGLLLHNMGSALTSLGRPRDARPYHEEALGLATRYDLQRLVVLSLTGLAFAQREELSFDDSIGAESRAAGALRRIGDLPNAVKRMAMIADTRRLSGHYEQALSAIREALAIARETDAREQEMFLQSDLAAVLLEVGQPDEAEIAAREALGRAPERTRVGPSRAFLLAIRAAALAVTGRETQAAETAKEALSLASLAQAERPRLSALLATAGALRAQAFLPDALRTCEELLGETLQGRRDLDRAELIVRATLEQARCLLAAERAAEAMDSATKALTLAEEKRLVCLIWRAHGVLARALEDAGDPDRAASHWRLAAAGVRDISSRMDEADLRRSFLATPEAVAALQKGEEAPVGAGPGIDSRLRALYEVIRSINSMREVGPLLERILTVTLDTVGAERGLILLADDEGTLEVAAGRGVEDDTARHARDISQSIVRQARKGKPVLSLDALHDRRFEKAASVKLHSIRSLMCVPLRMRDRIVGTVYLDNRTPGRIFRREDMQFLEAFADQAAVAIENARHHERLVRENEALRRATSTERPGFGQLVGGSQAMQAVYRTIERAAGSSLPVLITGETGTGKELVARSIHDTSERRAGPFRSENCSAIPETLIESRLFGHRRGAFTGAERDLPGLFVLADGGTLFLDEIGDMPPTMQAKLLRVLQDGLVRPIGASQEVKVDVRILTATNRDLDALRAEAQFRDDLFYRINVLRVVVPPLRERLEDIPALVQHFLARAAAERGGEELAVDDGVLQLLLRHDWPGNVRELQSAVACLALLARGRVIRVADLERSPDLYERLTRLDRAPQNLERMEKREIERALRQTAGNREKAAQILGISRATIFRRIKEYGIK